MPRIIVRLIVVGLILTASSRFVPAQAPPGGGIIAGIVVTDDSEGRPVRRATVNITVPSDPKSARTTVTDDQGRFAFNGLTAANYSMSATKAGFVTSYYGAKKPGSTIAVPINLTDGGRVTDLVLKMLHGGAITGVVTDAKGRPAPAVSIIVQRVSVGPDGQRGAPETVPRIGTTTLPSDDRGVYRVFGLPPGNYVVSASASGFYFGPGQAGGVVDAREPTPAELQWADRQLQGVLASAGPAAASAPPPGPAVRYATVFHPSATDAANATIVTVAGGQERTGIDIRMALVRTARIDGRVVDANGQPAPNVRLTLVSKESGAAQNAAVLVEVGLAAGFSALSRPDGSFGIAGVPPGSYQLVANNPGRGDPSAGIWAQSDLDVDGQDVSGMTMTLQIGATIPLRLRVQSAAAISAPAMIRLAPAAGSPGNIIGLGAQLPTDGTAIPIPGVVPGLYRVELAAGANATGWLLKSATLDGKDVADKPFEVKPGETAREITVTLTDALSQVTGTLRDGAGKPTNDLSVILFTSDPSLWFQRSRRLRPPVRPSNAGAFAFTGLPAGELLSRRDRRLRGDRLVQPGFSRASVRERFEGHARRRREEGAGFAIEVAAGLQPCGMVRGISSTAAASASSTTTVPVHASSVSVPYCAARASVSRRDRPDSTKPWPGAWTTTAATRTSGSGRQLRCSSPVSRALSNTPCGSVRGGAAQGSVRRDDAARLVEHFDKCREAGREFYSPDRHDRIGRRAHPQFVRAVARELDLRIIGEMAARLLRKQIGEPAHRSGESGERHPPDEDTKDVGHGQFPRPRPAAAAAPIS